MKTYRILDWIKLFENNRTRELKKLDWVPVPNKHDSDGFTDLITREDGPALYGAWILILQVASKCDRRGTLSRHNPAPGCGNMPLPHTAGSISRITRCPESLVQRALDACQEIGWIELIDSEAKKSHDDAGLSHDDAERCVPGPRARDARAEGNGRERTEGKEGKGTERNGGAVAGRLPLFTPSARFSDWWQLWSSVKGTNHRSKAEEAYREVAEREELDCFECTVSYLQSLDNPAKGYHPENFLIEQGKEKFKARWPQSTNGRKGPSVDELAESIDAFRRTR